MRTAGRRLEPIPATAWLLAATIALGAFMSQLDTSAVNVALRRIGTDLGAPLGIVQWTSTGYLLAVAVSLPASSWLARRLGSGRIWLGSVAAFTLASALCAVAPTVGWLIALRAAQGLSAGQLIPAGQTLIGRAVGPQRLGRVMATVGIAVSLAPALGPTVGGLLVAAGPGRRSSCSTCRSARQRSSSGSGRSPGGRRRLRSSDPTCPSSSCSASASRRWSWA